LLVFAAISPLGIALGQSVPGPKIQRVCEPSVPGGSTPQADRSTLRNETRSRAGQVSATSIEPTAHSPFNEKRTML
jgi:hypothetical protein